MKVMICQPMQGRSQDEIERERKEIVEKFNKMHIEVIDTLFEDEPGDEINHTGLFYLAKSIEAMSTVDAVYFANNWNRARGCVIERKAALDYGVKVLYSDFLENEEETVATSRIFNAFEID